MPKALTFTFAVLLSLALFASACGSDDDPEQGFDSATSTAGSPEPTNGFDGETIKLGYLTDQSSTASVAAVSIQEGSEVYWQWLNSAGGVAGKYQVELEVRDTMSDPSQAVGQYERIKDDVVMFAEILSTPVTQAVLEFLKEDNIIGVPGSWAGDWVGEAELLPYGAAYEYQMINLVHWYANFSDLHSSNDVHCAVSVDDLYGEVAMDGVRYALERLGLELAEHKVFSRGATEFTAQVGALAEAGCSVVYAVSIPTEQNAMLAQAEAVSFKPVWLSALPSYLNLFAREHPELYENVYVALDSPNLDDRSVAGLVDFLDRFADVFGDDSPNTFHLAGYFQSIAVHALLEKAVELGDLSREGMAAAMAQLGEVDNFGLAAENYVYGLPPDRVPTSAVRIFKFNATRPPNFLEELRIFDSELNDGFDLTG